VTKEKTTWSTPLALAIAVVMVFSAYLIPHWTSFLKAPHAQAGTTDDLLKAIATKDSDGDGLPDWEEALYGTDPHKVDTFGYGMTDAQAVAAGKIVPKAATPVANTPAAASTSPDAVVPGTGPASGSLTEQFTQTFFAQYLSAHQGAPLSSSDMASFVASAIAQLQQSQSQQDAFTLGEVQVGGSGPTAMRAYAIAAERAFALNTITLPKGELLYLSDAITKNDPTALDNVRKIANAYTKIGAAFMKLPVPTELSAPHLALANAFAQMGVVTSELSALNRDPLLTSLALANYPGDATAMRNAFVHMASALQKAGVVFAPGEPGYSMESITPENGY
jgi:hypothetical protein